MSTLARDLLKTKPQRIGEVYGHVHLKSGQADSQLVAFGGNLTVNGGDATKFDLSDTEAVIGGAIVQKAAQAAIVVLVGSDTAAGQFRKVLIQMAANGTVSQKAGAIVTTAQADAVKPAPDSDKIELGWLELPASFIPGTTNVTAGILKKAPYWT